VDKPHHADGTYRATRLILTPLAQSMISTQRTSATLRGQGGAY